jgi:hypothetical protein
MNANLHAVIIVIPYGSRHNKRIRFPARTVTQVIELAGVKLAPAELQKNEA